MVIVNPKAGWRDGPVPGAWDYAASTNLTKCYDL